MGWTIQFYDNNFFLREDHARELADRLTPLKMRWWCEARTDIMMRYSDATLEAIRRAGCANDKDLKAEDTLELASRIRRLGIIPEFSIIFGNPKDPEGDTRDCFRFIRNRRIAKGSSSSTSAQAQKAESRRRDRRTALHARPAAGPHVRRGRRPDPVSEFARRMGYTTLAEIRYPQRSVNSVVEASHQAFD
jgi:hypothetical protein